MNNFPNSAAWRPYLRALAESGLDVASVGAWTAAAELPPARRRLARAALAAVNVAAVRSELRAGRSEPVPPGSRSGLPYVDAGIRLPADESPDPSQRRRAMLVGAAVLTAAAAVSVGTAVAGRQLERRWLARLVRHGHAHPHRALGVRMAALYAVVVVPSRLLAARQGAKAGDPAATGS